jgi:glycosyltransferase involved in cell wall biosynthesis
MMTAPTKPYLSIVIPAFNEENNLTRLAGALIETLTTIGHENEIIFIDDGSTDGTFEVIREIAAKSASVRGVRLRRNFGKSNALATGFEMAKGDVIITLDADNQDDPREIPRFLAMLDEGYDLVSGWKKVRHDPGTRVRASHLFNATVRWLTGVPLHDFNCGFKAYRAEVVKEVPLYGEWHRFIPVIAADLGFKVTEVEVHHQPRTHGKSRYGWERYFRGFSDCLTILVLSRYAERPGHLFYGAGFSLMGLGLIGFLLNLVPLPLGTWIHLLFFLSIGLIPLGVVILMGGVLAEMLVAKMGLRRYRKGIREKVGVEQGNAHDA